jgi:D-alanyl-D-alanine carboxypeptidase (penicillin-binding protein 5/6)
VKTIILLIILGLQTTGIWDNLSDTHRFKLSSAAATHAAPAEQVAIARPALAPIPVQVGQATLKLKTASALAVDTASGTVLHSQDPGIQRPIASISKLVTCLVILSRHSADEIVTVPELPSYVQGAELMGLVKGEKYRLGDLVTAALVPSANDAADTLAIYDSGSVPKFAAQMNLKMKQWGIVGTNFTSPSGLNEDNNYATATALAKVAQLALTNPTIREIVLLTNATISSTTGRSFSFTSTNRLLASGAFYGIKTGYTQLAGECFVGLTRINGHEVITVVLGAENRFGASQELANWIGSNWKWL